MIAILPLLLALAALSCAVVIMVRQSRSAGRRAPAAAAGDPLFFVRYRPGVTGVTPARTAPEPHDPQGPSPATPENPPADEKS